MKREQYPLEEMKESIKKLETEALRLKELAKDIPGVQKNLDPIIAFIDILNYHLCDAGDDKRA